MKKKHGSKTSLTEEEAAFGESSLLECFPPLYDYLNLRHRTWQLELDVRDFDASRVADILALPLNVYQGNVKVFFWQFIASMISNCSLSFIRRCERKDMALVGLIDQKKYAIPLWKLTSSELIGFEIIDESLFEEENPTSLVWTDLLPDITSAERPSEEELITVSGSLFFGQKIFLNIHDTQITLASDLISELDLFTRIMTADIPELDEPSEDND
ncbi:MAG: hypothetical protein ACFFE8_11930 [Candidatus Heimdallarchaeota archaeon]